MVAKVPRARARVARDEHVAGAVHAKAVEVLHVVAAAVDGPHARAIRRVELDLSDCRVWVLQVLVTVAIVTK